MTALGRPLRVLIVDDEPLARRGLRQLLAPHADVVVVGECRDGREALAALDALAPDVVFLDVQMPELGGLEVVRARGAARMPATVFLTAYETFAVAAFEVEAVDYLVKPVGEERFDAALHRVRQRLGARPAAHPAEVPPRPPATRLVIPSARGDVALDADEIDWVGAEDYCVAVYARGRRFLLRASMGELEARLAAGAGAGAFVRVHRGALVNVARVRQLRAAGGRLVVVLADGTRVPVSRRRRGELRTALGDAPGAGGRPHPRP